jgi:hypothetical protein
MCLGVLRVPCGVPRLDLVDQCGLRRDTAPKALPTQMAEFDLGHIEPTAMFGRRMALSFIRDSFRLRRIKRFIQRCFGMSIQIVHHETNPLHVRIMLVNKFFDKVCPIHFSALLRYFGIPLTCSGFESHKNICGPIPLLLGVIPQELPRLRWKRCTHFPDELGRHCVHTYLGALRVIRYFINI